jgi:hypothetical protein
MGISRPRIPDVWPARGEVRIESRAGDVTGGQHRRPQRRYRWWAKTRRFQRKRMETFTVGKYTLRLFRKPLVVVLGSWYVRLRLLLFALPSLFFRRTPTCDGSVIYF